MLSQKLADELVWRIHTAVAPLEVRKTIPSDVTITTGGRSKRSAAPAWRHMARRGRDARVERPTVRHVRRQPANVVVVLWCGDLGAIWRAAGPAARHVLRLVLVVVRLHQP